MNGRRLSFQPNHTASSLMRWPSSRHRRLAIVHTPISDNELLRRTNKLHMSSVCAIPYRQTLHTSTIPHWLAVQAAQLKGPAARYMPKTFAFLQRNDHYLCELDVCVFFLYHSNMHPPLHSIVPFAHNKIVQQHCSTLSNSSANRGAPPSSYLLICHSAAHSAPEQMRIISD